MKMAVTINSQSADGFPFAMLLRRTWMLACLTISLLLQPAGAAESWPFVRGPGFDGHSDETKLIDSWSEEGPPVLWIRKLGQGYSAFVAKRDRVYTQAQNMTGQFVYCLEADTGKTVWEYRYDWPYESAGVYPGPRSTPTLYKGNVYFTSPDGLLGCLNQDSGHLLWSVDLLESYGIEGCDFGYACSPTLVDDLAILPVGGVGAGVVAFNSVTGREQWKATDEPASYTPALPIQLNGQPLVVCYMQNSVLILNRKTGRLRRKINLSHGYDEHSAWPIYQEPYLWLSGPFQAGSYVLDLSELNNADRDLTAIWRSKTMSNDVCSSVCVNGFIYGFDIFDVQSKIHRPSRGIFRCLDFHTGEEKWSVGTGRPRRSSNAAQYANDILQSGIIVADGKLIILNELGELILLKTDPERCIELARCSVLGGELTWTPPCLSDGRLYIRNQSQAVCVYLGDPETLTTQNTMRAGDIAQHQYYDLNAMVLAVEPEYAFDIPHNRWLFQWFLAGLGIILIGKSATALLYRKTGGVTGRDTTEFMIVGLLGAAGTTALGHLTGEFVFTWPVCLFASLEYASRPAIVPLKKSSLRNFVTRRIPLMMFLLTSVGYFLICRRLSLVFEWAFLFGFVGGLPVVWLTNRVFTCMQKTPGRRIIASVVGFACFFGATVAFLKYRY